jgi:hypothetical protein
LSGLLLSEKKNAAEIATFDHDEIHLGEVVVELKDDSNPNPVHREMLSC